MGCLLLLAIPRAVMAQQDEEEDLPDLLNMQVQSPVSPSAAKAPVLDATYVRTFEVSDVYEGESLAGTERWSGEWQAGDGMYTGVTEAAGNALLLLDEAAWQDLAIEASFRCNTGCEPGFFIHGYDLHGQLSGVLYSFSASGNGAYALTLDANGNEVRRQKLDPSPSPYPPEMMTFRAEFPGLGLLYAWELSGQQGIAPLRLDNTWNQAEIHMVGTSLRGLLNGAGTTEANTSGFGRVGLYVGGEAGTKVQFKNVGLKSMDKKRAQPVEITADRFEKKQLEAMFYSEAITAADVNLDGYTDVISGPNIFMGPDFLTRQELHVPKTYAPTSYPDPLLASAGDVTGDGYPDILHTGEPGRPGYLYVNPAGEVRRWDKYQVIASVDNEVAFLDDIDGDGELEYIYGDGGFLGYAEPGNDPTKPWDYHAVTEKGPWGAMYAHGLGTGDINMDGRKDLIQAYGWWEQPENPAGSVWTYHPETFGRWGSQQGGGGGARAFAYDVNGDGLNDIVTSLEAHGFGLAWFEQKRDAAGNISFTQHTIMDDFDNKKDGVVFAALHAVTLADVDGDGLKDIVTGKRWWAHFGENPNDPDAFGDPVIYWFKLTRDQNGGVNFTPHLINNNSGVGTDMITADLNNDGLPDILTSTRRGTNIFVSRR